MLKSSVGLKDCGDCGEWSQTDKQQILLFMCEVIDKPQNMFLVLTDTGSIIMSDGLTDFSILTDGDDQKKL